ncbi:sensor histidine kinase [Microlunatus flavus]|uniref:Histidine kinase-, DNA gyrase B-, and HSP90-like ATPase n=1 Tax=Microlunatus flavus TaxID=1036181 RepID=A0A1H9A1V3_9ACTN|nr:histidine kinase [Microlunatus flavus]SEP70595.1 Histidine kinase-, DNA gyrase B-, and HSP90-like ATPase [Microlunatus flavus]
MTTLELAPGPKDLRRWQLRPATGPAQLPLSDPGYVLLLRAVAGARLAGLVLAAPAVLVSPATSPVTAVSLVLLGLVSLALSRSPRLIRWLIAHPLLALLDTLCSIVLLVGLPVGQPATLTVVCTALLAGLVYPAPILLVVLGPLLVACLGAPSGRMGDALHTWQGVLAMLSGLPVLVVGVSVVGSVVRRSTLALVRARHEVAEAVAAVGAADERARLARDMHDSVGKSIHGISLAAKALRRVVERDPATARVLAGSLAAAADQAAREARTLLLTLREGQTDRPAVDVVTEALSEWQESTGITARLDDVEVVDADPRVTAELATALGEILHNVEKHAQASEVAVGLTARGPLIVLRVSDDGRGVDPAQLRARERAGHFGLRGLRERAEALGGTAEIVPAPAPRRGTTVTWTARRQPLEA